MKTTRLARRLGLDGNPLRRRSDKIAVRGAALLLAVFLIGGPLLSVAVGGWGGRTAAARQRAERSWHQVSAILLQAAPPRAASTGGLPGYSPVPARWITPEGQARTGRIPVSNGLAAGHTVWLWVDAAGSPTGPPLTHRQVLAREVTAAVVATITLGIVLLCLGEAGLRVLDRRRLADCVVCGRFPAFLASILDADLRGSTRT